MAWISELVGIDYTTQRLCVVILILKDLTTKEIFQNMRIQGLTGCHTGSKVRKAPGMVLYWTG
jgi:hypothetical protein